MEPSVPIEKITWIHRTHFAPTVVNCSVYLDKSLGQSYLSLDDGEEAQSIWHSFLALPTVYLFKRGNHTIAYNFAKIEHAFVSGHWGRFLYTGESLHNHLSTALEPFHEGAFDLALPSFRRWVREQQEVTIGYLKQCTLTIRFPPEEKDRASTCLSQHFPGIAPVQETDDLCVYYWTFGLDTWMDEAQLMCLGLYEHFIDIPGAAWPGNSEEVEGQTPLYAFLSYDVPSSAWISSETSKRPHNRWHRHACPGAPELHMLLSVLHAVLLWRLWKRIKRCT